MSYARSFTAALATLASLLACSNLLAQGAAGPTGAGKPGAPMAKTYEVTVQIQAGASSFAKWPSGGETWHHGIGFIDPFGTAEYFCGKNFPEAKANPLPDWGAGFFKTMTGSNDPLFCIYTTKEGSFYTYDSVPGTLLRYDNGGRDLNMNLVVGGTGAYKGATGVWIGRTEGVDPRKEVYPGRMGRETLLKVMSGYVKVPNE